MSHPSNSYKWYLLFLSAMSAAFGVAAPSVSLAVLFPEISAELHLTLVQMGLIWSIGSLPAIFISLLSGAVIDRFGPRRVLVLSMILIGLTAGMRGLVPDFLTFFLLVLLIGSLCPVVIGGVYKVCGMWFPPQQLGMAAGVLSMGFGFGMLVGSLLSATVLSPWLGGWRNVMFFYGAIAMLFAIPWYFSRSMPETAGAGARDIHPVPIRESLAHIVRVKNAWLIGITLFGFSGCVQGVSGYLPTYLRSQGWADARADGALSLISTASMIFVLPIALGSDRLRARKTILLGMILMTAAGAGLLPAPVASLVWLGAVLIGMVRDGSQAVAMTLLIENPEIGPLYAGTASGFVMLFQNLGNLAGPPLGNNLAGISPSLAFTFWTGMALVGFTSLMFVKSPQRAKAAPDPVSAG